MRTQLHVTQGYRAIFRRLYFISTKPALLLILLLAPCLAILALAGVVNVAKRERAAMATGSAMPGQGPRKDGRIATVIPTLTRFGFEPSEFKIPAGKCLLAVRNNSDLASLDLELARQAGQRLVAGRHDKGKKSWDQLLDITPGEYALTVAGRPEWVCKITVVPSN